MTRGCSSNTRDYHHCNLLVFVSIFRTECEVPLGLGSSLGLSHSRGVEERPLGPWNDDKQCDVCLWTQYREGGKPGKIERATIREWPFLEGMGATGVAAQQRAHAGVEDWYLMCTFDRIQYLGIRHTGKPIKNPTYTSPDWCTEFWSTPQSLVIDNVALFIWLGWGQGWFRVSPGPALHWA